MKPAAYKVVSDRFEGKDAVEVLAALAQPLRLELFRLLVRYLPYGLAAGEIARLLAIPQNTLSNHLSILDHAGLIHSRRDGRSIIYAADKELPLRLAAFLTEDCCQASGRTCGPDTKPFPAKREAHMASKTYNVLVLCTGNSARSILAEAILNKEGAGRIKAFSAGSRPKGEPNPHAIALLRDLDYDTSAFHSKSWEEFSRPTAPKMDFVLTVCDSAAGESCPYWPGHPLVAHWGIPDPAAIDGTDAEKRAAFMEAYRRLVARITAFVNLDLEQLDLASLKERLSAIGAMEGATDMALSGKAA
ncbi:metalloregulator ArsR/SmtB family transcription factor [Methylocapsa palsarum]|uniref:Arsenate reductase n=1 Tax=Methylocapsa palsarum TaxID=1612308 RepID=A0A1I4D8L3_9HYPH|nr:metalloregulator ArsR/SmtB family transcription factor [Methylocapsa palsarum]SFK89150.1 arsenate reductase [Methylocapsa palsarum]